MATLKKVGIFSVAKLHGVATGLVGLMCGIVYSFGGLMIDAGVSFGLFTSSETPGLSYGTVLAFGALIGMPLIFGAAGFVSGAISACFYNVAAKLVGGVEVDISQ